MESDQENPTLVEDVFKKITELILSLLEKGVVPWQRPWKSSSVPTNLCTNKEYRGINVLLLMMADFPSPYWLTARQAKTLGGFIRPAQKGTEILYWGLFRVQMESSADVAAVHFQKLYTVYNIAQCEGIPDPQQPNTKFESIEECDRLITGMPNKPKLFHGGNDAYYVIPKDEIHLPRKESFTITEEYYCTLFHELCHSTGHEKRLNRKSIADATSFGTENYSNEELIAEIGASFLCGMGAIENRTINNSGAYISGWLERLKRDKRLISMAANQAQKAVDYIRGKCLNVNC